MKRYFLALFVICLFLSCSIQGQVISSAQVDSLVERTLKAFDVPGIAVGIIKDGKLIHAKGYGVRSLRTGEKMNENTLFGIASNSKAFTTAAIALLSDEGKLKWDDKVIKFIPDFKLYDPYVSENFTLRDLVTHRSGLGLGAGDLMIWPGGSDFTVKDIIHNLRYLKQVSGFRTKYDYDNLLYVVAGEVVKKVSGMEWEEFVETRFMKPLGMTKSAGSFSRLKDTSNIIDPHAPVNGKVQVIDRDLTEVINPAGGIYSSVADMSKWVIANLDNGRYGDSLGKRLLSPRAHHELWEPQTIIPANTTPPYNTHFSSYGLGWFLSDVKGYKQVTHTGGLSGIVTQVTLFPELKLGIIVFTNQQSGAAFTAITNTIKDSYLGITGFDRVKQLRERMDVVEADAKKVTDEVWKEIAAKQEGNTAKTNMNIYMGTYRDPWLGDITLSMKDGKPWFDADRSPKLTGELLPFKDSTLIVKWKDRSMDADAYLIFSLTPEGKPVQMKMKAISPMTDFSYDFHDLDFKKIK